MGNLKRQILDELTGLNPNESLEAADPLIAGVDFDALRKLDKSRADKIELRIGEVLHRRTMVALGKDALVKIPR